MSPEKPERLNVVLTQDAADSMEILQERTGLKKVDLVNKGIMLLEFVEGELRQGREVIVRDPSCPDDPEQRFKLFL